MLWKDDNGSFKEYEPNACLLIEKTFQRARHSSC